MAARRRATLAIDALRDLVESGSIDTGAIARALGVSSSTVNAWLANGLPMPVERQLLLGRLIVDRVPVLERSGRRLLGHVQATLAYQSGATKTHMTAPVSRFRALARVRDVRWGR